VAITRASADADLIRRITGEYLEMPGLHLTPRQAQRLFGLDAVTCDDILARLLESGFLSCAGDGMFTLAQERNRTASRW
jgi:hypothetical protein